MSDPKKLAFAELLQRFTSSGVSEDELVTKEREHHEGLQKAMLGSRLTGWGVHAERVAVLGRCPDGWKETPAARWARHMASSPDERSMVLWGGKGCGKSVAAALWLTLAARKPIVGHPRLGNTWQWDESCKFASPGELARQYGSFDPEHKFWAEDLRRCRALVLDDFGSGDRDVAPKLTDVIYERNRRDLLTVITTNLSPDEFTRIYDARVADRLLQDGHFRACGAENLRRSA